MNTEPQKDLLNLTVEELIELLIEKTHELFQAKEKNAVSEFQELLVEVEEITTIIKVKRKK